MTSIFEQIERPRRTGEWVFSGPAFPQASRERESEPRMNFPVSGFAIITASAPGREFGDCRPAAMLNNPFRAMKQNCLGEGFRTKCDAVLEKRAK
jgi:hypothetical protein